jgi:methionyl-tRNA synthetase
MAKYLVTPALPYLNGSPHLGHLVEAIQVNVFVRALRMAGEDVLYVCGGDCHGTPVEIAAKKAGVTPEAFSEKSQHVFANAFKRFHIEYDGGFGTTHTPANEKWSTTIFQHLKDAGHITVRDVEQLFDPELKRFLPDRMVKGTCPKCGAEDQYGDSCEKCGSVYRPTELKNPRSALSGATPILRSSKHYFFELSHYADRLKEWTMGEGVLHNDVRHFLANWFSEGLKDWDISRDGPYFGFKIPGEDDKYFYVWLDAPIGYISLTEHAAKALGRTAEDYWNDPSTRIIHFIGKDIVYFHTLFWPAMLMASKMTLPEAVCVHGMLTMNGEKMSKSRGTFILADDFADFVNPEALRYYLSCKLSAGVEDIDMNFEDFTGRTNADLVNKIVNLLSRTIPLLHRYFDGCVGTMGEDGVVAEAKTLASGIEAKYRARDTSRVVKDVVAIADAANKYLQDSAPWELIKTDKDGAHRALTTALWAGKTCVALLKPILPIVAAKSELMLGLEAFTFANAADFLKEGAQLKPYERLFERIDMKNIEALVEKSKEGQAAATAATSAQPTTPTIQIDEFAKVDLRAAKVLEAKAVEGSDKLISLTLDVGALGKRHVFSGLRPHVDPSALVGHTVVLVANLAPRKMKFGVSEGMILSAVGQKLVPLMVDDAQPGDPIQ